VNWAGRNHRKSKRMMVEKNRVVQETGSEVKRPFRVGGRVHTGKKDGYPHQATENFKGGKELESLERSGEK